MKRSAPRPRTLLRAAAFLSALSLPLWTAGAAAAALGAWSFQSAPQLSPPHVKVAVSRAGVSPGLVFMDPFKDFAVMTPEVGQPGGEILDQQGDPVWFHPTSKGKEVVDLEAQRYNGKAVLTFWVGAISVPPSTALPPGTPEPGGKFYIYSNRYKLLRTIVPADGFTADPHEFTITPQGTALFTAVKVEQASVTGAAGQQEVSLVDSEIQEISLKTGKLVFSWDMLAHVSPTESEVPMPAAGGVWDPYHMNSIDEDNAGHLLASARNTSTLYEISRTTGQIVWKLGGKDPTYAVAANASFSWQHDARFAPGGEITLFDDACCDLGVAGAAPQHPARGLVVKLNSSSKAATLVKQYEHQPEIDVPSQGSMQTLAGGNRFIGWGQEPYYSEYTASGRLLYEVALPAADESYRARKYQWTATPYYAPSVAVLKTGNHRTAYASWNGATTVAAWEVLAGSKPNRLKVVVAHAKRRGFETSIRIPNNGRYFQVKALGASGQVLRASRTVELGDPTDAHATSRPATTATAATVIGTAEHNSKLGRILVASNGHALYMFTRDTKGVSTCSGTCTEFWKPLLAGSHDTVKPGSGLNARLLGTSGLSGGRRQVTYNHHPLYEDSSDRSANTTSGEGADQFSGRWYVLNAKGNAVKPKQNPTNPCNPTCVGY